MEELISVIVPVYNVEKYLNRCIDSIRNSTYQNLQIILVDDGSKDSSSQICDDYAQKDGRITVVHKENGGLGFARNSGLDMAIGKYVTFIDGDDYISPEHIINLYSEIVRSEADTCYSGYTRVFSDHSVKKVNYIAGKTYEKKEILKEVLARQCGKKTHDDYIEMSVCMVLFSNDIIREFNVRFKSEREFISEDLIFDFDYLVHSKRVCAISDVGYYYCDNEGSLTTRYNRDRFNKQRLMTKEVLERSRKLGIYDYTNERIDMTYLSIVRFCFKLEEGFSKQNGRTVAMSNIRRMLRDEFMQSRLKEFDDNRLPLKSKLVHKIMRLKAPHLMYLAMHINNKL